MPNHTPEEGLDEGFKINPHVNLQAYKAGQRDMVTTILERVNELYEEYGKGDGEYHDIIWHQDPRIELPQEALKKVSSLLTHLINQQ